MKVVLQFIGKTASSFVEEGIQVYQKRVGKHFPFEIICIPDVKKVKDVAVLKIKEGEQILKRITPQDYLILLDENGKILTSTAFADHFTQLQMKSKKRIVFQIGGAYGFSKAIYERADAKMSLSKMTFSHQLIRVIFMEQLYRAVAIQKNLPYHNA